VVTASVATVRLSPQPCVTVAQSVRRTKSWASWVPVTLITLSASPASSKFRSAKPDSLLRKQKGIFYWVSV